MDLDVLLTGGVGIVTTIASGWTSWFFARKKYNVEVDKDEIANLKEALDFYDKNQKGNKEILESIQTENAELREENKKLKDKNDELEGQVRKLQQTNEELTERICKLEKTVADIAKIKEDVKSHKKVTSKGNR